MTENKWAFDQAGFNEHINKWEDAGENGLDFGGVRVYEWVPEATKDSDAETEQKTPSTDTAAPVPAGTESADTEPAATEPAATVLDTEQNTSPKKDADESAGKKEHQAAESRREIVKLEQKISKLKTTFGQWKKIYGPDQIYLGVEKYPKEPKDNEKYEEKLIISNNFINKNDDAKTATVSFRHEISKQFVLKPGFKCKRAWVYRSV